MWNWQNNGEKQSGILYSRFIASWIIVGGPLQTINDLNMFKDWLRSLKLDEEDVHNISEMASNGKLELQTNAKHFIYGE